jgi:hypothetical protein
VANQLDEDTIEELNQAEINKTLIKAVFDKNQIVVNEIFNVTP